MAMLRPPAASFAEGLPPARQVVRQANSEVGLSLFTYGAWIQGGVWRRTVPLDRMFTRHWSPHAPLIIFLLP